ncbi:MAG: methyltransferase [Halobacteriovorax sp.]|nr:methyltransferase [Halobacteriovorax sp.]|tara:strand:+ start:44571 stop:45221 length:651 start_codon:yes stop_codon:yes gene_type:complete
MNFINEEIENYAISKSNRPSQFVKELGEETKANIPMAMMLVGEMEGSLLGFLVRSLKVKRVLEIGTYTGYSALCMAENLPMDGEVITLDIDDELTPLSKKYWGQSPDGNKIKKVIGPALETIPNLEGSFDLVFIDADKQNYLNYLKMVIPRLSEKGIVVVDNVLWSGNVLKAASELEPTDNSTTHIQALNDYVCQSNELYGTLLPIRDGIFLITKT